nr:T9SS type A sorting domain-containing protein [Candidatus Krumholzibacteria bacterium]
HYYIQAADTNDQGQQTAIMPADTTGFSSFAFQLTYDHKFTVRALPSVVVGGLNPAQLVNPDILFWDDSGDLNMARRWHAALVQLYLYPGVDYDFYVTKGAALDAGNGLGERASAAILASYEHIVYSSGAQEMATLSQKDLVVLDTWLRQEDKNIFLAGDNLVSDLTGNEGPVGDQFVSDWLRVTLVSDDLAPLVNRQSAPLVKSISGNGVFRDDSSWIADGGCPSINRFDAVESQNELGALRLAEFCDTAGNTGVYSYSAATMYQDPQLGSKVISLPYDLGFVSTSTQGRKVPTDLEDRVFVLKQVLGEFGYYFIGPYITVPEASSFAVKAYPNPFNPLVRIQFNLPGASHLELKIFNVRGELVRTLLDDFHAQGSDFAIWAGQDQAGHAVASGVYFYQLVWEGGTVRDKIVLLR